MDHRIEFKTSEEKKMGIQTIQVPASKRKAMMVVLAMPCFSRNRCDEGKAGKKGYRRHAKHKGGHAEY
jgi:hypothetical protein